MCYISSHESRKYRVGILIVMRERYIYATEDMELKIDEVDGAIE